MILIAVLVTSSLLSACSTQPGQSGQALVEVPADAPTISAALELVSPGGLILVSPGEYPESVTIDVADVTLRGTDRNAVIIDGEGLRANGVQVVATGVRVQNLTVRNHTFNGVLVTGMRDANGAQAHNLDGYEKLDPEKFPPLERFEVSNVTASNNGLYGIYAFNSRHGVIRDNYASGSADSGFYVGQCAGCDILVTNNVAENNAIGYENANASDSVLIAGNRFSSNRVGLTLLSWYQEAYLPQKSATVVGNLIADNTSADSPAQALGAFGIGVGLSGANTNTLERNLIAGNASTGVQVTNTEDLASTGNRLVDNSFVDNGIDLANLSAERSPSVGTCVEGSGPGTVLPAGFGSDCAGTSVGVSADRLPALDVPAGLSFLKVSPGPDQPDMTGSLRNVPRPLPDTVAMPNPGSFALPDRTLLADRAVAR
ncbi:plasmid stabilization protein [Glaciihabitans arcticus]|uniref:Plasmid stabilization protein n=1 Tax=Glaciihabitans arcticus TaxID=2668039 RepID=A0A4Q9GSR9_9MICO|nr:right-handed parallel beta-helix repeat-containing protein [Glaciihabitans arcticus]TBN58062.1 plasmid stabilization protein [Glaciihabitans arcticus]